jgi:oligopeptide transport system permease protein
MRGAVLEIKSLEFVDAATAIGASKMQNLRRHIVPNALAPVIVTTTISLGVFIVAESSLSFLGLGLPSNVVSWGNDIAAAQNQIRSGQNLEVMFVPAAALALTVLGFILLGEAVREALDPKARKK